MKRLMMTLAMLAGTASCQPEAPPLDYAPCPCGDGYKCCEVSQRCVPAQDFDRVCLSCETTMEPDGRRRFTCSDGTSFIIDEEEPECIDGQAFVDRDRGLPENVARLTDLGGELYLDTDDTVEWPCLERFAGSMFVEATLGISFPNLTTVTGELYLDANYDSMPPAPLDLSSLRAVGADLTILQFDVSSLPALEQVEGAVVFSGVLSEDLDLSTVRTVRSLSIDGGEMLRSLRLPNDVSYLTGLTIQGYRPDLRVSGLSALDHVDGSVTLSALWPLPALRVVRDWLDISGASTSTVVRFPALERARYISLSSLTNVERFDFPELVELETLEIRENLALMTTEGFGALVDLERLEVRGHPRLHEIAGFGVLERLDRLWLEDNAELEDLAFESLRGTMGTLDVSRNAALRTLSVPVGLTEIRAFNIELNSSLQLIVVPPGLESLGTIDINDNPALEALPALPPAVTEVGSVAISGNPRIVDMAGFESVARAESIEITASDGLTSLRGLDGLQSIQGGLRISDNLSLVSLAGLDGLTTVQSEMSLGNNAELASLDALASLQRVGSLHIAHNPLLVSLTGLDAMDTAGGIVIESNVNLVDLGGLQSVAGAESVAVRGNPALVDIAAIGELADVRDITITNNPVLTTLFEAATSSLDDLTVTDNACLPQCLADAFRDEAQAAGGFDDQFSDVEIVGNRLDCTCTSTGVTCVGEC